MVKVHDSDQNPATNGHAAWHQQDEVVISGISCRLPESENMREFGQHLFNGEDMVTDDGRRWEPGECLDSLKC